MILSALPPDLLESINVVPRLLTNWTIRSPRNVWVILTETLVSAHAFPVRPVIVIGALRGVLLSGIG